MKRKRLETPPDSSFASLDLPLLNERSEIDMKRTKLVLSYSWTYSWTKKSWFSSNNRNNHDRLEGTYMFCLEKYSYRSYKGIISLIKARRNETILFPFWNFFVEGTKQTWQALTWRLSHGAHGTPHGVVTRQRGTTWHVHWNSTPFPLDRCHVVRVFAGGCAWELGYGHRPMSCVHTPCCTHSYAAPPPSYSAVKLLLTFVSFILSIDSCPQPFPIIQRANNTT